MSPELVRGADPNTLEAKAHSRFWLTPGRNWRIASRSPFGRLSDTRQQSQTLSSRRARSSTGGEAHPEFRRRDSRTADGASPNAEFYDLRESFASDFLVASNRCLDLVSQTGTDGRSYLANIQRPRVWLIVQRDLSGREPRCDSLHCDRHCL
jgi:hypothetical protein